MAITTTSKSVTKYNSVKCRETLCGLSSLHRERCQATISLVAACAVTGIEKKHPRRHDQSDPHCEAVTPPGGSVDRVVGEVWAMEIGRRLLYAVVAPVVLILVHTLVDRERERSAYLNFRLQITVHAHLKWLLGQRALPIQLRDASRGRLTPAFFVNNFYSPIPIPCITFGPPFLLLPL